MEKRQRTGRNRVTLSDVARHAGVSPMTASRALNAPAQVSADLRASVMRSVAELGYIQNRLAGALASRKSNVVAIVIPSLTNNVFIAMTNAIHTVLLQHGVQPLITVSDYSFETEQVTIGNILSWSPDGLVLVGLDHSPELRRLIEVSGIPVVETVQAGEGAIDLNVGIDQVAAGVCMGEHLVARGYKNVFMFGPHDLSDSRLTQRFDGCASVLARHGLDASRIFRLPVSDSLSFGREMLVRAAGEGLEKSAVFFGNDLMGLGALQGAKDLGLKVPDDIGIAGFNGLDIANYVEPRLTTISVPYVEMGRRAAAMLLASISGEPPAERRDVLEFELVPGAST